MKKLVQLRPVRHVHEWQQCFDVVAHPHFTQAYAYGQAKRQAGRWHVSRWIFEVGGAPVALCQVLEKRIGGVRVAARINRGPLFLDPAPSRATIEQVYQQLRRQWRHGLGGVLALAPALPATAENFELLRQLGYRNRQASGWCSSLVDLTRDTAALHAAPAPVWRNRLRAALNSGLQLEVSDSFDGFAWMLARHRQNMRDKHFSGPDCAFLADLYAVRPADYLVLRALHDGQAVAGMLVARFGHTAEYFIGWFGAAGRPFNCGNFLYWHALLQMKQAGCRWFDLGGYTTSDRYGHFKQNMRGAEYRLAGEWLAF